MLSRVCLEGEQLQRCAANSLHSELDNSEQQQARHMVCSFFLFHCLIRRYCPHSLSSLHCCTKRETRHLTISRIQLELQCMYEHFYGVITGNLSPKARLVFAFSNPIKSNPSSFQLKRLKHQLCFTCTTLLSQEQSAKGKRYIILLGDADILRGHRDDDEQCAVKDIIFGWTCSVSSSLLSRSSIVNLKEVLAQGWAASNDRSRKGEERR